MHYNICLYMTTELNFEYVCTCIHAAFTPHGEMVSLYTIYTRNAHAHVMPRTMGANNFSLGDIHWRIQKLREGGARPHALAQSGQATPTMHVVNFDPSVRRCGIASPSCRGDGVAA